MSGDTTSLQAVPDLADLLCELLQDAHAAYPQELQKLLAVHVPVGPAARLDPLGTGVLPLLTALCVRWYTAIGQPIRLPAIQFTDGLSAETRRIAGAQPYLWSQYNAGALDTAEIGVGLGHAVCGTWTTDTPGEQATL